MCGAGALARLSSGPHPFLPRAFPEPTLQWPAAMSSLTVARQRGICTRFPILLSMRRTRELIFESLKNVNAQGMHRQTGNPVPQRHRVTEKSRKFKKVFKKASSVTLCLCGELRFRRR